MADTERDIKINIDLQPKNTAELRKAIEDGIKKPLEQISTSSQNTISGGVPTTSIPVSSRTPNMAAGGGALPPAPPAAPPGSEPPRDPDPTGLLAKMKAQREATQKEIENLQKIRDEQKAAQEEAMAEIEKYIQGIIKKGEADQKAVEEARAAKRNARQEELSGVRTAAQNEAAAAKLQETQMQRAVANARDARIRELTEKERTAKEEVELLKLTAQQAEQISAARARAEKIRQTERIAAFKREKAEEARLEQEKLAKQQARGRGGLGFFSETRGPFGRIAGTILGAPAAFNQGLNFLNKTSDAIDIATAVAKALKGGKGSGEAEDLIRNSALYKAGEKFWAAVYQFAEATDTFRDVLPSWMAPRTEVKPSEVEPTLNKGIEAQRQLNAIILERTKTERALVDAEERRIEQAKKEYGLMTQEEQQGLTDLAAKIKQSGIGGISGPELEAAKRFSGFSGLITEQAAVNANLGGFDKLLEVSGVAERTAEARKKIKEVTGDVIGTVNQNNMQIQVDIDPAKIADQLEERIRPMVEHLNEIIERNARAQAQAAADALRKARGGLEQ